MGKRLSDYENTNTMPCKPYFMTKKFLDFLTNTGKINGLGRGETGFRPDFLPFSALCLGVAQASGDHIIPCKNTIRLVK